jgi:hypothetical protein
MAAKSSFIITRNKYPTVSICPTFRDPADPILPCTSTRMVICVTMRRKKTRRSQTVHWIGNQSVRVRVHGRHRARRVRNRVHQPSQNRIRQRLLSVSLPSVSLSLSYWSLSEPRRVSGVCPPGVDELNETAIPCEYLGDTTRPAVEEDPRITIDRG